MIHRKATIYLIRHGQTDWNVAKKLQGLTERPLTERGKRQAKEVGLRLKKHPIRAVYSSTLIRAKETAHIIADLYGHPVTCEHELREGAFGKAEGLTWEEYHAKYEAEIAKRNQLPKQERLQYELFPDIESHSEIANRALSCLKKIAKNHLNEHVVVVSHGRVIQTLILALTDEEEVIYIDNGSVLELHSDGEAVEIKGFL